MLILRSLTANFSITIIVPDVWCNFVAFYKKKRKSINVLGCKMRTFSMIWFILLLKKVNCRFSRKNLFFINSTRVPLIHSPIDLSYIVKDSVIKKGRGSFTTFGRRKSSRVYFTRLKFDEIFLLTENVK